MPDPRSSGRAARIRKLPVARSETPSGRKAGIGLALAGGGPLGGIYEVGALLALADSLDGIDFGDLDAYVGVSSGGFVAAALLGYIEALKHSSNLAILFALFGQTFFLLALSHEHDQEVVFRGCLLHAINVALEDVSHEVQAREERHNVYRIDRIADLVS